MEATRKSRDKLLYVAAGIFLVMSIATIIYAAKSVLVPLGLGFVFANLLYPSVRFLKVKLRFPDLLAILLSMAVVIGVLGTIFTVLGSEIGKVFKDLPQVTHNAKVNLDQIQGWVDHTFHLSYNKQTDLIKSVKETEMMSPKSMQPLFSLTALLLNLILIPIYTFLILIYRKNLVAFIVTVSKRSKGREAIPDTLELLLNINSILMQYLSGLGIEMFVVAMLTGTGLWLIGVKYFVFLGILTGMLNLIPYIGILIAGTISILMTLAGTTDLTMIGGVVAVNVIVQLIDNNFLLPKIVGSKVSINALASVFGVIIGGALAGVGGMFLALPVLAVLNIIFDHTETLRPFNYLIGEKKVKNLKNGFN
ncbi:MAG: AI-2E family transporter [Bacteroidota bacterium]